MSSQAFREQIYKTGRQTLVEVSYSLTAPDSKDGGIFVMPPNNEFSHINQAMNENRIMTAPVATLEPDYWRLDGTFILPVPPSENIEAGWWSDVISDENGYFETPLVITREFEQAQLFNQVSITFDHSTNNFCSEFKVDLYDTENNIIYSENIINNTQPIRATEKGGENILKVVITLYRTNNPFRYARVIEIDFGLIIYYTNKELISLNSIRETDYLGKSFIIPQFNIVVQNKGDYNVVDKRTYAPYFQTRQRFFYRIGLILDDNSTEWINCGTYFLQSWAVNDKNVSFNASGKTVQLENFDYYENSFNVFTLQQLINRVFSSINAQINVNLQSPRITGYFGEINYRDVLRYLAELSCCLVYEDENNIIQFKDILSDNTENSIDTLDYKNMYGSPNIQLSEYYNSINLTEYFMSVEFKQVSSTEQTAGEIKIFFDNPINGIGEIDLTDGFSLTNIIWYTNRLTGILTGNGTCIITVTGNAVTLSKEENLYNAPWHTGKEPNSPYAINIPCMIKNSADYENFKSWFLDRKFKMLEKRMNANVYWYQNPERKIGDIVETQINRNEDGVNFHIVSQEIKFAPRLKGNTKIISPIIYLE